MQGAFSPEITARYKKELAGLGQQTNRLRDLDVYLLQKDTYQAMVPVTIRPGLDHFFTSLAVERARERQRFGRWFNGPHYGQKMKDWADFLDGFRLHEGKDGAKAAAPVIVVARKYVLKTWARAIDQGRKITDDSADADLHRVRLQCKKLRYLLEFFSSIFPKKRLESLVGPLKKVQDVLGNFNDICVQRETLQGYLKGEVSGEPIPLEAAAAVGGLIAHLNDRQQEVRLGYGPTFAAFDCPATAQQFLNLFGDEGRK